MALQERRAVVEWNGDLMEGNGVVTAGSGAFTLPVTFSARTQAPGGKTSPEELIAAAQAICYAMAFSNKLTKGGHRPTRLNVSATCSLNRKPAGGLIITDMDIGVSGIVPGLEGDQFQAMAVEAEKECPVANALRNNLAIRVHAKLEA